MMLMIVKRSWHSSMIVFQDKMLMLICFESIMFILISRLIWRLLIKWIFWIMCIRLIILVKTLNKYRFKHIYFWHLWILLSMFHTVILITDCWINRFDRYWQRNCLSIKNIVHSVLRHADLMKSLILNWKNIVI